MAPFDRPFSSSSPVLVMPPQPSHQGPVDMPSFSRQSSAFNSRPPFNDQAAASMAPAPIQSSQRPSVAGRKRSRDEASTNLNEDSAPPLAPIEPIKESEDDWIYGEGMVLIKANQGYVGDASSQSGTWVEEQAEEEARRAREAAEAAALAQQQERDRPSLRSYKSQRLDSTPHASASQEFLTNGGSIADARPSPQLTATLSDVATPPVVDDFTLHLGIGWNRISDDEHIQAAARGWSRFIENRYPLTNVQITLESKGLQSYLVVATEGYFLFSEDLRQGKLVSTDADKALQNLRHSPPIFDGTETLNAAETPKPVDPSGSDINLASATDTDMEMS